MCKCGKYDSKKLEETSRCYQFSTRVLFVKATIKGVDYCQEATLKLKLKCGALIQEINLKAIQLVYLVLVVIKLKYFCLTSDFDPTNDLNVITKDSKA